MEETKVYTQHSAGSIYKHIHTKVMDRMLVIIPGNMYTGTSIAVLHKAVLTEKVQ